MPDELSPLAEHADIKPVPSDSRELYDIEVRVVAATPSILDTGTPEEFLEFLNEGGVASTFIKYDEIGNAVGYLALSALHDSDAMEVRSIAVEPEQQHRGYGKSMMLEAERIAKGANRSKITLVTSPDNVDAIKFYQALGYKITSTADNYYGDRTPRHILEKHL